MRQSCSRIPRHAMDSGAPATCASAHCCCLTPGARTPEEERARSGRGLQKHPLVSPRRGALQSRMPPLLLRPSNSPTLSPGTACPGLQVLSP